MQLALRFWTRVALWTGILLVTLMTITLIASDGGMAAAVANLPSWAGLALVLSAFPAGIAVSRETLPEDGRPTGE